ncbi:MAG: TrkA family potassium uptake protein [Bacilli bacterium]|jgi:trk system potassium uptake protein TrkA
MSKKSFAVIGLGQFGLAIVGELAAIGADVIAIDRDEASVRKAGLHVPTAFIADATDEKALRDLDVHHVTHAIVAFGDNIQASILTTVILANMNIPHIVVRVDDDYYVPIIKKLGATEIIMPQRLAGHGLANRLDDEDFLDYYSLGDNFSVVKITVGASFVPQTILAMDPRNKYNVNLILLTKNQATSIPRAADLIEPGDSVFVVGKRRELRAFGNFLQGEE